MYFYLLFSLFLSRRWPWAVVGIPCLGSFVALAAEHWLPADDLRDYLSNPIFYEFCYGLALAAVARKVETSWSAARLFVLAALGFAAAAIWHAFAHPQLTDGLVRSVRFVLWGAPAALAVAGALALREGRGVGMRVAAALGDASYAIYLTHGFVMTAYARALKSEGVAALLPPAVWIALVLAAVVVLGWCAHVLVERRLTAWIKPLLRSA
jgi:peptidoglycan/LPS O-acetylase OafA/YrhL